MYAMKVMTHPVVTVPADATVWAAADILLGSRISAAPVVDADGRMIGIVSEADLMNRPETGTVPGRSWLQRLLAAYALAGWAREQVCTTARGHASRRRVAERSRCPGSELAPSAGAGAGPRPRQRRAGRGRGRASRTGPRRQARPVSVRRRAAASPMPATMACPSSGSPRPATCRPALPSPTGCGPTRRRRSPIRSAAASPSSCYRATGRPPLPVRQSPRASANGGPRSHPPAMPRAWPRWRRRAGAC